MHWIIPSSASVRQNLKWLILIAMIAWVARPIAAEHLTKKQALASITSSEMRTCVELLADDTFEGRAAGSRGGRAAAGYLAKQLAAMQLKGGAQQGRFAQVFGSGYRNILAVLEGSDPTLKEEVILLGAHYDHVGYGTATNSFGPVGYIHNGADDNASGTATLLEVAEALAQLDVAPKRTVLFALWDGEEAGLLGSKHWTSQPTVEMARIKFVMNLDMVGRLKKNRLQVFGTRTGPGLRRLVSEKNVDSPMTLEMPWKLEHNSDHAPFLERNIPILMLHTGLHDDYHRPSDDAHLLNYEGMQKVGRLAFEIIGELANMPQTPPFRRESHHELATPAKRRATIAAPPRLGLSWRRNDERMIVTRLTPGLPAATAGMQVGDEIVKLDNQSVNDDATFKQLVLGADSRITLQVRRGDESELLEIPVDLQGRRTRVGIRWSTNSAEPGVGKVVNVVPGAAAELAGVKVGDRIYEVSGHGFQTTDELRTLLTSLQSPLELRIERDGVIQNLSLDVPAPAKSL